MKILWILDSDAAMPEQDCLRLSQDVTIENAHSGYEALGLLRHGNFDVILAYFPISGWEPHELLEGLQRENSSVPVIVRDPDGTFSDAVRLTKLGAFHFLGPQVSENELLYALEAAVDYRRTRQLALFGSAIATEPWRKYLVGDSRAMRNVGQIIRMVGPRRCTVLITGETGTGKELAARALHAASNRGGSPMVALNCSALPENLLEAELFGHVRGAFTGAIQNRIGRFEQANRSTLFLDEIGDMPIDLQAKLLRVLQEREFQRLGSSETIKIDVRMVAASNVDLVECIRQGRFREDLYYRLNVVPLHMPPLRDRISDVRPLALHLVEKVCQH
ncbi:MAG: sigma-54 dependent transcriptional regulator, partial [Acidobacteria bacterium]|nr:sigma-54 dependent transcriptional regulator [Acidobacteriota bacterium]